MRSTSLARFSRVDYALASLSLVVGGAVAVLFLWYTDRTFFYQTQMPAIAMAACGKGFVQPAVLPAALADFLFMRTPRFDCAELSSITETGPIGNMAQTHLYLASVVAALWRWFGVSYQSLAPLLALLHGAYVAGCFVLGRLFFRREAAFVVALILALSPVAVSMLFHVRDFSKAPFIIWALTLMILAVREDRPACLLGLSLALGVVIGLGTGFRYDVITMFPVAALVLALGLRRGTGLGMRGAALLVFAAGAVILIKPLNTGGISGGSGFLWMEGMTEPFRAYLGLKPAPYDLGSKYMDELAFASISSDLRKPNPAYYDATEGEPFQKVTQALTRSNEYVLGWAPLFSADIVTRGIQSTLLIAGYYSAFSADRRVFDPFPAQFSHLRAGPTLSEPAVQLVYLAARPWLPILGLLGLVVFFWRAYGREPREAACLAFIFGVLLSYPSIQFSSRHFFHLEIVFWLGLLALVTVPFEWTGLRAHVRGFGAWAGGLLVAGVIVYLTLFTVQNRQLRAEVQALLDSPKETIAISRSTASPTHTLFGVPVPSDQAKLVESLPDSLSLPAIETVPPFNVRSASERLLVEIGGPGCPAGPVEVKLSYRKRPGIWQPLDRTITIDAAPGDQRVLLVTSAFYRPTQYFEGFELPDAQAACLGAVRRLHDSRRLPAVFTAVLPPDWTRLALHLWPSL